MEASHQEGRRSVGSTVESAIHVPVPYNLYRTIPISALSSILSISLIPWHRPISLQSSRLSMQVRGYYSLCWRQSSQNFNEVLKDVCSSASPSFCVKFCPPLSPSSSVLRPSVSSSLTSVLRMPPPFLISSDFISFPPKISILCSVFPLLALQLLPSMPSKTVSGQLLMSLALCRRRVSSRKSLHPSATPFTARWVRLVHIGRNLLVLRHRS